MTFKKGDAKPIGSGRTKGSVNATTAEFKQHLNKLLEHAAPHMVNWLDQIAADSPEKAFDILSKFAEYIHPKLARTEHTGKDGEAIKYEDTSLKDKEILKKLGME